VEAEQYHSPHDNCGLLDHLTLRIGHIERWPFSVRIEKQHSKRNFFSFKVTALLLVRKYLVMTHDLLRSRG